MMDTEISDLVYIDDRPAGERLARLREYRQDLLSAEIEHREDRDMLLAEVTRAINRLSLTPERPDIPYTLAPAYSAVRAFRA